MPSARAVAKGQYREELLSAIDAALELDPDKRPRSLAQWRSMFDLDALTHQGLQALSTRAHPRIMRLVADLAAELGLSVSFEEGLAFSLACCVIELRQRTGGEMTGQDAWKICEPLAYASDSMMVLSGGVANEAVIKEDKDIEQTFTSRFEQYSAAYTLDAEGEAETFALTSERLGRNLFPRMRELEEADALPRPVQAAIADMLRRASSVVGSAMESEHGGG
jgi:hypothetical protein